MEARRREGRDERYIHVIGGSPVPLSFHQRMGIFNHHAHSKSPFRPVSQFVTLFTCSFVLLSIKPSYIRQLGASPLPPAAYSPLPLLPSHAESPPVVPIQPGSLTAFLTNLADPHRHRTLNESVRLLLLPRRRRDDNQRRF